ncbi:MAG: 16S rRNA (adenine(1518)-N(6)/adenine(1519)-N(6))-dimethyltransferase RsmA [Patescibacteria group bacterium]|jgi:16S rRNA (adenine1518-N6/adenine1519-N6)-dimethyltransferase
MTPTDIKAIMQSIDSRPIHALGQNFLVDQAALKDIVQAAEIKKGEHILEIGPGLGVLTKELIASGAHVTAIEKDKKLLDYMAQRPYSVQLHHGDAAKLDWNKLIGNKPWKFISNLPYSITSLALRKSLYEVDPAPELLVVLVQREVAERVLMRDSKMSLLSLMVGLAVGPVETHNHASNREQKNLQIIRRVPPGAFYPPPKVESAILKIVPTSHESRVTLWGIEPEDVMSVAKKGFAHPRKLLFRNLGLDEKSWTRTAENLGINIKARAEDLNVQQWVELARTNSYIRSNS